MLTHKKTKPRLSEKQMQKLLTLCPSLKKKTKPLNIFTASIPESEYLAALQLLKGNQEQLSIEQLETIAYSAQYFAMNAQKKEPGQTANILNTARNILEKEESAAHITQWFEKAVWHCCQHKEVCKAYLESFVSDTRSTVLDPLMPSLKGKTSVSPKDYAKALSSLSQEETAENTPIQTVSAQKTLSLYTRYFACLTTDNTERVAIITDTTSLLLKQSPELPWTHILTLLSHYDSETIVNLTKEKIVSLTKEKMAKTYMDIFDDIISGSDVEQLLNDLEAPSEDDAKKLTLSENALEGLRELHRNLSSEPLTSEVIFSAFQTFTVTAESELLYLKNKEEAISNEFQSLNESEIGSCIELFGVHFLLLILRAIKIITEKCRTLSTNQLQDKMRSLHQKIGLAHHSEKMTLYQEERVFASMEEYTKMIGEISTLASNSPLKAINLIAQIQEKISLASKNKAPLFFDVFGMLYPESTALDSAIKTEISATIPLINQIIITNLLPNHNKVCELIDDLKKYESVQTNGDEPSTSIIPSLDASWVSTLKPSVDIRKSIRLWCEHRKADIESSSTFREWLSQSDKAQHFKGSNTNEDIARTIVHHSIFQQLKATFDNKTITSLMRVLPAILYDAGISLSNNLSKRNSAATIKANPMSFTVPINFLEALSEYATLQQKRISEHKEIKSAAEHLVGVFTKLISEDCVEYAVQTIQKNPFNKSWIEHMKKRSLSAEEEKLYRDYHKTNKKYIISGFKELGIWLKKAIPLTIINFRVIRYYLAIVKLITSLGLLIPSILLSGRKKQAPKVIHSLLRSAFYVATRTILHAPTLIKYHAQMARHFMKSMYNIFGAKNLAIFTMITIGLCTNFLLTLAIILTYLTYKDIISKLDINTSDTEEVKETSGNFQSTSRKNSQVPQQTQVHSPYESAREQQQQGLSAATR